eukprot:6490199-Amphidinium_carterae.1
MVRFIYSQIKEFGALVFAATMNVRQLVSIIVSYIKFGHAITPLQVCLTMHGRSSYDDQRPPTQSLRPLLILRTLIVHGEWKSDTSGARGDRSAYLADAKVCERQSELKSSTASSYLGFDDVAHVQVYESLRRELSILHKDLNPEQRIAEGVPSRAMGLGWQTFRRRVQFELYRLERSGALKTFLMSRTYTSILSAGLTSKEKGKPGQRHAVMDVEKASPTEKRELLDPTLSKVRAYQVHDP